MGVHMSEWGRGRAGLARDRTLQRSIAHWRMLRLALLGASLAISAAGPEHPPLSASLPCPPLSGGAAAEGRELVRVVAGERGVGSGRGADAAAEDCPVTVSDWGRPAGLVPAGIRAARPGV